MGEQLSWAATDRLASFLLKPVRRACREFNLIEAGDRIAVAVSGGKDSRALLELLWRLQRQFPHRYDLVALHIVGGPAGLSDVRPVLEPWLERLGVTYQWVPLELPPDEPLPLNCFRCAWNRRKALFKAAVALGCQKLAFGHHADDAAVTTLMNLMFTGRLETLAPRVSFFGGTITVIRPLIYVPEKELVRYSRAAGFTSPPVCPQGVRSSRAWVRRTLRHLGPAQEQIRTNLWRAARQAMGF